MALVACMYTCSLLYFEMDFFFKIHLFCTLSSNLTTSRLQSIQQCNCYLKQREHENTTSAKYFLINTNCFLQIPPPKKNLNCGQWFYIIILDCFWGAVLVCFKLPNYHWWFAMEPRDLYLFYCMPVLPRGFHLLS